jgi:hypothetical protein
MPGGTLVVRVAAPTNQEVTTNRDYIIMNPDFSKCSRGGIMTALSTSVQQIVTRIKSREIEGR